MVSAPTHGIASPEPHATHPARWQIGDLVTRLLCQAAACSVILIAVLLLLVIVWKSWLSIQTNGLGFFTGRVWNPEESFREFGSLAFAYGTVVTSALAMLIAVPLGIGSAAYLSEIAPEWVRKVGSFLIEMLAAVPSVVYGFWGMFVLGPFLQKSVTFLGGPNFGGVGILPASLILAIMIVPYITAVSFDVCRAVPSSQREGALALGATRWQTVWTVVLPYARPGITGACFLALGRALGETMAVTMLIGNSPTIHLSLFAKGDTIASLIANQFPEATYDLYLSALVQAALVLFLVTLVVNSAARVLIWRVGKVGGKPLLPAWLSFAGWRTQNAVATNSTLLPDFSKRARLVNRLMTNVLAACLVTTIGPLFLILGYLLFMGIGALDWNFFTKLPLPVGEIGGGIGHAFLGSAMLVGAATLVAVPFGLLAAIYLSEYPDRWLAPAVRFVGELLGGVPSIVIGIFAYTVIVQTSAAVFGRASLFGWAGVFALAIMMIPIVMRASEEALKLVPQTLRHASFALGATKWQTLVRVTVPAALPSIITAVFLSIARIVGETAPLILTSGDARYWPTSLNDYTPSLTYYIYTYAISPYEDWRRQAWAAALVLLAVVMLLNFGVRFMTGKRQMMGGRAD